MKSNSLHSWSAFFLIALLSGSLMGCSSSPSVKQQGYAKLKNERTFENEFHVVWKGIEESFRKYKIVDRDPSDVDPTELRRLTQRTLDTDWIYGQSRDKYQEYQVNGTPRKVYLQTRIKYQVIAKRVMGGVNVAVKTEEEVEKLKNDGTPEGYSSVKEVDSSRANEVLDKIQQALLSAPNI